MILTSWAPFVVGVAVAVLLALGQRSRTRRRRLLGDSLGGRRAGHRISGSSLYRFPLERSAVITIAALIIGVAASEPRLPGVESQTPPPPIVRSVILALDVSASMQATDADPTRLGQAVRIANALVQTLEEDRIGLTLFAGEAYPLAPPTRDHAALRYLLGGVTPTVASAHDPGSLLSVGVGDAARLLTAPGEPEGERTIVVIGDGEAGEIDSAVIDAVAEAAAQGITIHAIGVGTPDGAGFVMPEALYQLGGRVVDGRGAPVVSRLRETTLSRLAAAGGGRSLNASDETAVQEFLASLEAQPSDVAGAEPDALWERYEPTVWLIVGSLLLLFVDSLVDVRLPKPRPALAQGEG